MVITDKAGLVPLMQKNIEANAAQPRCGPAPQTCTRSPESGRVAGLQIPAARSPYGPSTSASLYALPGQCSLACSKAVLDVFSDAEGCWVSVGMHAPAQCGMHATSSFADVNYSPLTRAC